MLLVCRLGEASALPWLRRVHRVELAERMRWDRTRLAHQVKRSQVRGLIRKRKLAGASLVKLTEKGELLLRGAIPAHAQVVRK